MTDLVAFLRARLDEDEAAARGSGIVAWLRRLNPDATLHHTEVAAATIGAPDWWVVGGKPVRPDIPPRVIYDERRVIADVEAKRRILDYRDQAARAAEAAPPPVDVIHRAQLSAYDATIRALALPFAGHPDYDESWRG